MPANPDADSTSKSAAKKKRKSKKKVADKTVSSNELADTNAASNGTEDAEEAEGEGEEEELDASRKPSVAEQTAEEKQEAPGAQEASMEQEASESTSEELPIRNGHTAEKDSTQLEEPASVEAEPAVQDTKQEDAAESDTSARLEAMAKDRDNLRAEVAELRKSLETVQGKHAEELSELQEERNEAQTAKENAESQYRTLLGKVNTIRSQLGERLKADAEELSQARAQIEQLHEDNKALQDTHGDHQSTISQLTAENSAHSDEIATLTLHLAQANSAHADEITTLRSRTNLSTSNWSKERDDLNSQLAYAREEFDNAKQAMQDWEVLAMEERSLRENLSDRVSELEEQLHSNRELYDRVVDERDGQNSTIDGLQRALQDIQEARKTELREMVENSQAQLDALRKQAEAAAQSAAESASQLEATQKELERALPFEKEVKEKNLLIGKLRHEAVILNDHLTKALRFLRRGKPEDNVDRQIVTNHLLHFLALDRSDPKKFQILQLIAALLGWTEEQREQAGLARPGASNFQLRVPLSPFRRTPSTPSLSSDLGVTSPGGASRESLAELWSDFLEREAQDGTTGGSSRRSSVTQHNQRHASVASPPLPSPPTSTDPGLGIRTFSPPTSGMER